LQAGLLMTAINAVATTAKFLRGSMEDQKEHPVFSVGEEISIPHKE